MAFNNLIDLDRLDQFLGKLKVLLNSKVDKETGKGLSTEDYSTAEKTKLAGIAEGAQVNTVTGVKGDSEAAYRTGDINITKANIGLGNVENKTSATIRGELTKQNVTDALGYTPPQQDTTYDAMTVSEAETGTSTTDKLISAATLDAAIENKGYTSNAGTVTGITMNGSSKGTSGVIDLGTVLTAHQDISGKLDASMKGAANGLAELDSEGKVPASQLPSYVDDIVEYNGQSAFPAAGESGKIYIDTITNKTYRWSGSAYVAVSSDIVIGTTAASAFRGDYGQAAYEHAVTNKGSAFASGLYKITTNAEGHVTAAASVEKSDITALGIPSENTTYDSMTAAEAEAGTGTTGKLISPATLKAAVDAQGYTKNTGTITGISMNGASKGTSGVVDLGTVITAHQDISGKADKASTVSNVAYDTSSKKLTQTINGEASDIVTMSTLKTGLELAKSDVGLGNVDNTSDENKPVSNAQQAALNLKVDKATGMGLSSNDFTSTLKSRLEGIEAGAQVNTITGVKGGAEESYRTGNVNITKANLGLGNVEDTALSTWTGSANLTTSAKGTFGDIVTHGAAEFAAASHGTHVTATSVKAALGTGSGTDKFLREDGTWAEPAGPNLSAYRTASDQDVIDGAKYEKPSTGIPKTDLSSDVQTSLSKADSAYQKPSGGIPASDLASGVIPSVPSASSTTPAMNGTAAVGTGTTWARADHVHPIDTSRAAATSVPAQASIDANGLVTFKNSAGTVLFTLQLPLYNGGNT